MPLGPFDLVFFFFFFALHFLKPLKFVLGLPKWKFLLEKGISHWEKKTVTEGPHHKLLTGPFSLNMALIHTGVYSSLLHLHTRFKVSWFESQISQCF